MGNNISNDIAPPSSNDVHDHEDLLTRRVQVCEVQVAADEERENRILSGRPVNPRLEVILQALHSELLILGSTNETRIPKPAQSSGRFYAREKHGEKLLRLQFSKAMADVKNGGTYIQAARNVAREHHRWAAQECERRRRLSVDADRDVVAAHISWANRRKASLLSDTERARQLSVRNKRPSETVDVYDHVVKDIKYHGQGTVEPSSILKKQRLIASFKALLHATRLGDVQTQFAASSCTTTESASDKKHLVATHESVHPFPTSPLPVSSYQKTPASDCVPLREPVLWISKTQFENFNSVVAAIERRATIADVVNKTEQERAARVHEDLLYDVHTEIIRGFNKLRALDAQDDEQAARIHKDQLYDVHTELQRRINQCHALRAQDEEQQCRITATLFKATMDELTQVYRHIVVNYMCAAEKQERVNKNNFLAVCEQVSFK